MDYSDNFRLPPQHASVPVTDSTLHIKEVKTLDEFGFTDDEFKQLTGLMFTPQRARVFLDDLLTEKIARVAERIEMYFKKQNCKHDKPFFTGPGVICRDCGKTWE